MRLVGCLLVLGDGAIVRSALDGLIAALHQVAEPTGSRGSILLMAGGLVVLGFLFVSFLFRSAIVGDLAPSATRRTPNPRAVLPGDSRTASARPLEFHAAREAGRALAGPFDAAIDELRRHGMEARILLSDGRSKHVRLYECVSCGADVSGCEHERGLLAGLFEARGGGVVRVHEVSCRRDGGDHCEFEITHASALVVR